MNYVPFLAWSDQLMCDSAIDLDWADRMAPAVSSDAMVMGGWCSEMGCEMAPAAVLRRYRPVIHSLVVLEKDGPNCHQLRH